MRSTVVIRSPFPAREMLSADEDAPGRNPGVSLCVRRASRVDPAAFAVLVRHELRPWLFTSVRAGRCCLPDPTVSFSEGLK